MPHPSPQQPAPTGAPIQPPTLRRPLPSNQIARSRPIGASALRQPARKAREPALLYPDLPETPERSGGTVTRAEFWRAAFLRNLAEFRAGQALASRSVGFDLPTRMFLAGANGHSRAELRDAFEEWSSEIGGLAGNGGAA